MATLTIADLENGKRDLETVDAVANSQADTTTTRYGDSVLTLAGALRRLGWQTPVPYASGLAVTSDVMTVERDGVVYRPDPALVPFTTGAWNPDQWRVVQNTEDSGLVYQFPALGGAQAAAATLPEGASIVVEGESQGHVAAGEYVADSGTSAVRLPDYAALGNYVGKATAVDITSPGIAGRFYRRGTAEADGGTVIKDATGRSWERDWSGESVNAAWFGAKGDKTTDDTDALQKAVNFCCSFPLAKTLVLPGMCKITSSLKIDRLVDSTLNEFFIVGIGTESGLYADSSLTFFDSDLPMPGVDPQSEFITFQNVRFEGSSSASVYTLTQKFLRIKFLGCYWYKCRLITSNTYLQTFYFSQCNIRYWPGVWCVASHAFDTHFSQVLSEFGGGALTFFPAGSYSLTFRDGCHEGSGGPLVSGGGFRQLVIDGMYLEQNSTPNVDLNYGPQNYSVQITNCMMMSSPAILADPLKYDIIWGPTMKPFTGGNFHQNGRLHDASLLSLGAYLAGSDSDYAALSLTNTPSVADRVLTLFSLSSTLGSGSSSNCRFSRDGGVVTVFFSFTFASTSSGSPAVLFDLPIPSADGLFSGEITYSDYTAGSLRVLGGASFAPAASPSRFGFAKDLSGTAATYTELAGKTVSGKITYRAS